MNSLGVTVFSDISNTLLLDLSFPQDTFVANSTFAPTSVGEYYISMWGVGDSAITSTASLQTTVTDYIYGRDEDVPDGFWRVGRSCGGMVLGVKYDMYADKTLYGIYVHINDVDLAVPDQFWIKHKGGGINDAVTPAEYSVLLKEILIEKQKEKEKKEN